MKYLLFLIRRGNCYFKRGCVFAWIVLVILMLGFGIPQIPGQAVTFAQAIVSSFLRPTQPLVATPSGMRLQRKSEKIQQVAAQTQSTEQSKSAMTLRDVANVKCVGPDDNLRDGKFPATKFGKWFDAAMVARGSMTIQVSMSQWYDVGRPCCGLWMCITKQKIPKVWHGALVPFRKRRNPQPVTTCPKHIDWLKDNLFGKCPTCKYFVIGTSNGCGPMLSSALRADRTQGIIIAGTQERDSIPSCDPRLDQSCTCDGSGFRKGTCYCPAIDVHVDDLVLADLVIVDPRRTTPEPCSLRMKHKIVNIGEYWRLPAVQQIEQERIMNNFTKALQALLLK